MGEHKAPTPHVLGLRQLASSTLGVHTPVLGTQQWPGQGLGLQTDAMPWLVPDWKLHAPCDRRAQVSSGRQHAPVSARQEFMPAVSQVVVLPWYTLGAMHAAWTPTLQVPPVPQQRPVGAAQGLLGTVQEMLGPR